jgi:V-type H+-transporting ATPase subunit d
MNATTFEALKESVKGIENYRDVLHQAPDPTKKEDFNFAAKTLDDIMYEEETRRYSLAFD